MTRMVNTVLDMLASGQATQEEAVAAIDAIYSEKHLRNRAALQALEAIIARAAGEPMGPKSIEKHVDQAFAYADATVIRARRPE